MKIVFGTWTHTPMENKALPRSQRTTPQFPAGLAGAILLFSLFFLACGGVAPAPDVIIITVDTLRPDYLGVYGNRQVRTPNIDALAGGGRLYTQATTPFPRTTPAIASLFTGLWPQHHGSREVNQPMWALPTLASVLRKRGYTTIGISASGALTAVERIDQGFDSFIARSWHARQVTDATLQRVQDVPRDSPLFLWVHYYDPHYPYEPWDGWESTPEAPLCRALSYAQEVEKTISWSDLQQNREGISSRAMDDCLALYGAEIAFTDSEIGRLLEALAARGRSEPLIVFTSDHGENFGEAGLFFEHGPNVHDASLRVPLILAGPGIRPGVDDGVARLEDLMPTLLVLLGVPEADWPPMDGADLLDDQGRPQAAFAESGTSFHPQYNKQLLTGRRGGLVCIHGERFSLCGEGQAPRRFFDHIADPSQRVDLGNAFPQERARLQAAWAMWPAETGRERTVRTPRFKLVRHPTLEGTYRSVLHDLTMDPGETEDAGSSHAEALHQLSDLLAAWTAGLSSPDATAERTAEELEKLRSLGYLQ